MEDLTQFDAFDYVSNEQLKDAYYQALVEQDPDVIHLEKEMVKRGLLGKC